MLKIKKELIRLGTVANVTTLEKSVAFDLLFDGFHKFVYLPDYVPWLYTNGTWTGAFGHLMNGMRMD